MSNTEGLSKQYLYAKCLEGCLIFRSTVTSLISLNTASPINNIYVGVAFI